MNLKHVIRDTMVSLISVFGISMVYRHIVRNKGPLVRIIVFHDVADRVWFEEIIEMIHKKYTVITPEQFHIKKFDQKKINIVLTFDDGYQTWIDNCIPVLAKYNAKGIFFINSGLLDCAEDSRAIEAYYKNRVLISPKQPLTWKGAHLLLENAHTIGGHTVTHPDLAKLDILEQTEEVVTDKKRIETMLSIQLQDFAYPFGRKNNYTTRIFDVTTKAGYTFTYAAHAGFVSATRNENITRVCLEKNQKVQSVSRWIDGGYDIFN